MKVEQHARPHEVCSPGRFRSFRIRRGCRGPGASDGGGRRACRRLFGVQLGGEDLPFRLPPVIDRPFRRPALGHPDLIGPPGDLLRIYLGIPCHHVFLSRAQGPRNLSCDLDSLFLFPNAPSIRRCGKNNTSFAPAFLGVISANPPKRLAACSLSQSLRGT